MLDPRVLYDRGLITFGDLLELAPGTEPDFIAAERARFAEGACVWHSDEPLPCQMCALEDSATRAERRASCQ